MMINRWHFAFILILTLGGYWLWVSRVPVAALASERTPQPAVGYPAPDFTLSTLAGEEFSLSALRGQPVVLNFWATWCIPCQRELPALRTASQRYQGEVAIIAVDQGESAKTVQGYVDKLGLPFTIPLDADTDVGRRYNVYGLPTTYFIDRQGIIRQQWTGEMNSITLAEGIAKIR
jgi:cytochrome c biogenesis protein CcmG, thiol:disulfide interchange protein DsbE